MPQAKKKLLPKNKTKFPEMSSLKLSPDYLRKTIMELEECKSHFLILCMIS